MTQYEFTSDPTSPEQDKANFIASWKIEVRKERDKLLAETDYIHLPDVTVSDTFKANMITYRQALRDIPSTVDAYLNQWSDINEMTDQHWSGLNWPTKPTP
jgi:hypothetical protein